MISLCQLRQRERLTGQGARCDAQAFNEARSPASPWFGHAWNMLPYGGFRRRLYPAAFGLLIP